MKKIFVLITLLAAAISCSKEQPKGPEAQLTPLTFTAVSEQTKTSLDGQAVLWSTTDHVMVFASTDYDTPYDFAVTSIENGGRKATISGLGSVTPEYFALFPYQADALCNGAEVTLTIPTDQAAVAGSFGPAANPAVAHIVGTEDLLFQNVGALLAVNIQATDVTGLKVESLNGTEMTGPAQFDFVGSEPVLNDFVGGQGKAYVQTTVSGAGVYYLVVAPGDYSGGFRLTFTKSGYKAVVENTKDLIVARNDNVNLFTAPADIPWQVQFTPGEKVYLRGVSSAEAQEVSYIPSTYYAPCYVNPSTSALCGTPGNRGDANNAEYQMEVIPYNYEVWAKIDPSEAFYFETESGARFGLNEAGTAVAPIGADETGAARTCYNSPFRIRLNLPSGDAQILRVSIVNFAGYYTGMNANLNYDQKGVWKVDNQVFSWTEQSWDPEGVLTRYLFKVWFDWKGSSLGGSYDVWQTYGTCSSYNNLNIKPQDSDPANPYYYLQPFTQNGDWEAVFYWGSWMYSTTVNNTKKGTINFYMNADHGHFTHNFTNVVDNN